MKNTMLFVTALGLVATPALADTVVRDGVTYTYDVVEDGGARIITGTDSAARPFVLRVAHGWVHGSVDGKTVSFSLRDVKPLATAANATVVATR